jgi:hypothetical protein
MEHFEAIAHICAAAMKHKIVGKFNWMKRTAVWMFKALQVIN